MYNTVRPTRTQLRRKGGGEHHTHSARVAVVWGCGAHMMMRMTVPASAPAAAAWPGGSV